MAIPEAVVECCCYPEPEIVQGTGVLHWFISQSDTGGGSGDEIGKYSRSDGNLITTSTFSNAATIFSVDDNERFYGFISDNSGGAATREVSLTRYHFDGTIDWTFTRTLFNFSTTFASHVDVNHNGYIGGQIGGTVISGTTFFNSFRFYKIDSSGTEVWNYVKNGTYDSGTGIVTWFQFYNVSSDLNGNIHLTGRRLVTDDTTPNPNSLAQGHFEIHLDSDGNELWSDISTNTASGSDLSYGRQSVCDENGNTFIRYFNQFFFDDDITLKGFDSDGNELFANDSTDIPLLFHMEVFNGKLFTSTSSGIFRQYSGTDFLTTDWDDTLGYTPSNPRVTIDSSGDAYATHSRDVSGTQVQYREKYVGSTGVSVFEETTSNRVPEFPLIPPGRAVYA